MNRLPNYDAPTSRIERSLFVSLGLAAFTLIVVTASDAIRFSNCQDEIIAALSSDATALASIRTNLALTNLTVLQSGTAVERARVDATARPKS
jgi:hypothetical protein